MKVQNAMLSIACICHWSQLSEKPLLTCFYPQPYQTLGHNLWFFLRTAADCPNNTDLVIEIVHKLHACCHTPPMFTADITNWSQHSLLIRLDAASQPFTQTAAKTSCEAPINWRPLISSTFHLFIHSFLRVLCPCPQNIRPRCCAQRKNNWMCDAWHPRKEGEPRKGGQRDRLEESLWRDSASGWQWDWSWALKISRNGRGWVRWGRCGGSQRCGKGHRISSFGMSRSLQGVLQVLKLESASSLCSASSWVVSSPAYLISTLSHPHHQGPSSLFFPIMWQPHTLHTAAQVSNTQTWHVSSCSSESSPRAPHSGVWDIVQRVGLWARWP